jgi:hypothetical protein
MKFLENPLLICAVVAMTSVTSGCSSVFIENRPGSDRISLADANQVNNCQPKGETVVSVLTTIAFFTRPAEAVEDNLYQLARNDAVDSGADTLVKGESKEFGKRAYKMYKCRP